MIQTKLDLDKYSFEIVIEFFFNIQQGFSLFYKYEGAIIWINSMRSAEQHFRYKFICSGVMLNRCLCLESGEDEMLVLVPDLIIPLHKFLVAPKWEEDWADIF